MLMCVHHFFWIYKLFKKKYSTLIFFKNFGWTLERKQKYTMLDFALRDNTFCLLKHKQFTQNFNKSNKRSKD